MRYGITIDEVFERFDDEHLDKLFALSLLDETDDETRRTGRICASINNSLMNAARSQGGKIDDRFYRSEDDYIPQSKIAKRHVLKIQTWDDQRTILGFD